MTSLSTHDDLWSEIWQINGSDECALRLCYCYVMLKRTSFEGKLCMSCKPVAFLWYLMEWSFGAHSELEDIFWWTGSREERRAMYSHSLFWSDWFICPKIVHQRTAGDSFRKTGFVCEKGVCADNFLWFLWCCIIVDVLLSGKNKDKSCFCRHLVSVVIF